MKPINHLLALVLLLQCSAVDAIMPRRFEVEGGHFVYNPKGIGILDDVLFFATPSGYLFRSDGTSGGTQVLSKGPVMGHLFKDGMLYFATAIDNRYTIWRLAPHDSEPTRLFSPPFAFDAAHWAVGDGLFAFGTNGYVKGDAPDTWHVEDFKLYVSDGSETGAVVLRSIPWPPECFVPSTAVYCHQVLHPHTPNAGPFIELKRGTLFVGPENEVFYSDGTPMGVRAVTDSILADWSGSGTVIDGILFFAVTGSFDDTGRAPFELWKTEGTAASTERVAQIGSTYTSRYEPDRISWTEMIAVGSGLFFMGADDRGRELWWSDGTEAGTRRVADLVPGPASSAPGNFVIGDGTLYFRAWSPEAGFELWRSDGTEAGSMRISDIFPGVRDGVWDGAPMVYSHGTLFFTGQEPNTGYELYQSDGTFAGTHIVADLEPGFQGSAPQQLTAIGRHVFFEAGFRDRTLWTLTVAPCAGDCDEDERVTVAELVRQVSIVLEQRSLAACEALDSNEDDVAGVEDLVSAVGSAIHGCD